MFRSVLLFLLLSPVLPLYAWEGFSVESLGQTRNIESRKHLIERVLTKDSMHFWYSALSIIIDAAQKEPRGKMQGRTITLSASVRSEGEFLKLLVHELGHYVDIYSLLGAAPDRDISDQFYAISWIDRTTKRSSESLMSFVSGYAASNKYEDFAESFTFYIFHNKEFAERAMKNESLRQKYIYFSQYVFSRGEFIDTDFRTSVIPSYIWDTTKIPVSVKKYLYSLR